MLRFFQSIVTKGRKKEINSRIENGVMALRAIDAILSSAKVSRQDKRIFWRDFINDEQSREKAYERLMTFVMNGSKKFVAKD